jgi:hypothetical protein
MTITQHTVWTCDECDEDFCENQFECQTCGGCPICCECVSAEDYDEDDDEDTTEETEVNNELAKEIKPTTSEDKK